MHKTELCTWIIRIVADKSERHVCLSLQWPCLLWLFPSSAFVTDAGSIVLQMPRNRKRVTQKEKEIIEARALCQEKQTIEAYAFSQNALCFEIVARVTLLFDFVGKTIS